MIDPTSLTLAKMQAAFDLLKDTQNMGTDIHMWVEYSPYADQEGNPHWYSFTSNYNPGRDYHMFEIMAGVRGDEQTLFETRGVPEGRLSWDVEQNCKGDENGLHSHSWLTFEEYAQCVGTRMLTNAWGPPDIGYDVVLVAMKAFEDRGIKTRLVFGFDS